MVIILKTIINLSKIFKFNFQDIFKCLVQIAKTIYNAKIVVVSFDTKLHDFTSFIVILDLHDSIKIIVQYSALVQLYIFLLKQ